MDDFYFFRAPIFEFTAKVELVSAPVGLGLIDCAKLAAAFVDFVEVEAEVSNAVA